jgi:hypothetical protein
VPVGTRRRIPAWPLLLMLFALFGAQIWIFRWGVITPDTVFQWRQALTGSYDDWHPPVTAWLWRQLMPLGDGTAPVLIFDCALYWLGAGLLADALRRRGQPWAMAAVLIACAAPIPFGQIGAILKDPLLAACCLTAAGLILTRETMGGGWRPLAAGMAGLLLVLATATRFNAVFATAPLLVALLPARDTNRPWRIIATLAAAAALLFSSSTLINRFALQPHRGRPIFSLINFDLAGIVAHGGGPAYPNLTPEAALAITARCYAPNLYNPTDLPECNAVEDALSTFVTARHISPLQPWLAAVAASPGAYLRHRLAHLNRNLRLFVSTVPADAFYVMSEPNDLGLRFVEGPAARLIYRAAVAMAVSPLGRPATWLAVAVGLLLIGQRLPSSRFILAAAASPIGYGGGYAAISVASDLRYNLWTMLAAAIALVVAIADCAADPQTRPRPPLLALAALPTILVVAVELTGLALG